MWADGQPLAQIEPVTTGGTTQEVVRYLHTDHLNTPRLATNQQAQVIWRWEGSAFGVTYPNEDVDGDGKVTTVNLRFPGQYYDAESGLHYNWNRYYDPKLGRYVTSDPIGLRGGLNTFSYVKNNPLRWKDPTGLLDDLWPGDGPIDSYPIPWGLPGSAGSPCGSGFTFPAYTFGPACIRHDACYGTCGANKAACDFEFLWNMQQSCQAGDAACRLRAQAYFEAVLHFGGGPHQRGQDESCRGCKR